MQDQDDREYYRRRAEEERRAAKGSGSARAIHSELAQRYAALPARPLDAPKDDLS